MSFFSVPPFGCCQRKNNTVMSFLSYASHNAIAIGILIYLLLDGFVFYQLIFQEICMFDVLPTKEFGYFAPSSVQLAKS